MCIVVDACAFSPVFNPQDGKHLQFKPVLEWIVRGKGKLVYGGSRYRRELRQAPRYHGLFTEFRKTNKVVEIEDGKVDMVEQRINKKVNDAQFDDAHLVGIVVVSRCKIVCTNDRRAIPFLKRSDLYPSGIARPKIYLGAGNKSLLCDQNIAAVCKPPSTMSRDLRELFSRGVHQAN